MITIDWETYYDKDYSLSKMTMEEYLRDRKFQCIGFAIMVDDGPIETYHGSHADLHLALQKYNWANHAVCMQNAMFDAAILSWHFGIVPKMYVDTMSMAKALYGIAMSCSLASLAKFFGLPDKGHQVESALGLRYEQMTPAFLDDYIGVYCKHDTWLCREIYKRMRPMMPTEEMMAIDWTIQCYAVPTLVIDQPLAEQALRDYLKEKQDTLNKLGVTQEALRSDDIMAQMLIQVGCVPPTKFSGKQKNPDGTPKEVWAFSKADTDFMDLLECGDPQIEALVEARLANKTSIVETRLTSFGEIGRRGRLPYPLAYAAAQPTLRWQAYAAQKINLQNLPRAKKGQRSPLRDAIKAPPGSKMLVIDLSQIELRVNAWLAGQQSVLDTLRTGGDVYCNQASRIFMKPVDKSMKLERFVGKTAVLGCFTADTLVLTRRGAVPIVSVTQDDYLWDGVAWVQSDGAHLMGRKRVSDMLGVRGTDDHRVLGLFGWRPLGQRTASTLSLLSAIVMGAWSSRGMSSAERLSLLWPAVATAEAKRSQQKATCAQAEAPAAPHVAEGQVTEHGLRSSITASVQSLGRTVSKLSRALVSYARAPLAVAPMSTQLTTCAAAWLGQPNGVAHAREIDSASTPSCDTSAGRGTTCGHAPLGLRQKWLQCMQAWSYATAGKTSLRSRLTQSVCQVGEVLYAGSFWTGAMARAAIHRKTADGLMRRPVLETYDVVNAGPRNRYTILTEGGPVLVHNCGYQCGGEKFTTMLKVAARRDGFKLQDESIEFGKACVKAYRDENPMIVAFWADCQRALETMAQGGNTQLGPLSIVNGQIYMPDGMWMYFPNLRWFTDSESGKEGWVYDKKLGRGTQTKWVYGGLCCENLAQRVARGIMRDGILRLRQRYWAAGSVHDEAICLIPEQEPEEQAMDFAIACMTQSPAWAPNLPLAAEGDIGYAYGDCK